MITGLARRLLVGLVSMLLCLQGVLIIALGIAAFVAWMVFSTLNGGQPEPWAEVVGTWALRTAFTFVPLGFAVLMLAGPHTLSKDVQPQRADLPIGGSALLMVSLLGLAALSIIAASPLIAVWTEVYEWLTAAGAWSELRGAWSSQFGGIVLAPFLIGALVPFLELAPAAAMVAGSAALLILYFSRAAHFPRVFLATVLSQGAFVAASFYILDLASDLTPLLLRELSEQVDFGPPAIEWLQRHDAAAGSATRDLGWLFLGYLVWVPVLFWSRRQAAQRTDSVTPRNQDTVRFQESKESERESAWSASDALPGWKPFVRRVHWVFRPPRSPHVRGLLERRLILGIRLVCLVLGVVMLFDVIEDLLATRARYVSSSPGAGAMVDRVPDDVTIRFSHTLDPVSSISVHLAASPSSSGELSYPQLQVITSAGIDSHDLQGRSLRAALIPGLAAGLYRVDWKTVAKNEQRASRSGWFFFGVGIPTHILRDLGGPLEERDTGISLNQATSSPSPRTTILISGLLFLGLAAALPRLWPT
jgi:methionine-rich copper-binding protein CopC